MVDNSKNCKEQEILTMLLKSFWDFEKIKQCTILQFFLILAKNHIFKHISTRRISESELKPGRYSPTSYLWDKTIWRPIITIVLWPLLIEIPNFHENYFSSQFFFILYHLSLKIAVTLLFYDYKRKHLCLSYDNNQLVFKNCSYKPVYSQSKMLKMWMNGHFCNI